MTERPVRAGPVGRPWRRVVAVGRGGWLDGFALFPCRAAQEGPCPTGARRSAWPSSDDLTTSPAKPAPPARACVALAAGRRPSRVISGVGGLRARRQRPDTLVDFSPSVAVALERYWATMGRWRASVAAMTGEQLDTVGFGQSPNTSDPEVPFITVIAEANLELIHHMAEIALLRDLYRTRPVGAR